MRPLLEINRVEVRNGFNYRLKDVHLSISQGDKIALLGKSGAGKSSLIAVANGSLKTTKGQVKWLGKNLNSLKAKQLIDIGTLWQDLRLVEELNVEQNINVGALGRHNFLWAIKNLLGILHSKRSLSCLYAAGLSKNLINASVSQISGGQRQRVAIARLLRQEARLVLADEPLSNLDPRLSKEILALLLNQKEIDSIKIPETYLISLHRPDLIHNFSRVLGLYEGEIVIDLPTKELSQKVLKELYI